MITPLLIILLLLLPVFGKECRVQTKEAVRAVYGSGVVKAQRQILLRSSVSGYVVEIRADRGDRVKKGQLLALIDSGGLKEKISALDEKIKFLRERIKPGSEFRESLERTVEVKRENLEKAERKYKRRRELYSKGVIPREALETAELLYRTAREDLRIAELKLRDTLKELRSELDSLSREREALRKELEKYRVKSPIDGVVLRRFVEKGDYVNPMSRQNALFSIGTLKKKVVLYVDEELAPLIKKGQKVYITTDAVPGKVFEGKVTGLDLESEPARRVVEVEVSVELPKNIPVNSVVEGNIVVSRLKTTVVPIRAVKDRYAVLLVNGKERKVRVNRVFEKYGEVLGYPPGTPCLFSE